MTAARKGEISNFTGMVTESDIIIRDMESHVVINFNRKRAAEMKGTWSASISETTEKMTEIQ